MASKRDVLSLSVVVPVYNERWDLIVFHDADLEYDPRDVARRADEQPAGAPTQRLAAAAAS